MKYQLFYREHRLGSIEQSDADFPTFFGSYEIDPAALDLPELAHVRDYIEFSVRTWPAFESGDCDERGQEDEERFMDLIEENSWFLVDEEDGHRTAILIPVFQTDQQVNWRLNPSGWSGALP